MQRLNKKSVAFCCHFTVHDMRKLKISQADGEKRTKPKPNPQKTTTFLFFYRTKPTVRKTLAYVRFPFGMILTVQLPNPVSTLIKATGTFCPMCPAASHHLQHSISPCQTPLSAHLPLAARERRFHLPRNGSSLIGDAVAVRCLVQSPCVTEINSLP